MLTFPIRLLVGGYGTAAGAALLVGGSVGGILLPLLVFWIGGAVCVLGLGGLLHGWRGARAPIPEDEVDDDVVAELARWEADRLADDASRTEADRRGVAL